MHEKTRNRKEPPIKIANIRAAVDGNSHGRLDSIENHRLIILIVSIDIVSVLGSLSHGETIYSLQFLARRPSSS